MCRRKIAAGAGALLAGRHHLYLTVSEFIPTMMGELRPLQ